MEGKTVRETQFENTCRFKTVSICEGIQTFVVPQSRQIFDVDFSKIPINLNLEYFISLALV